MADTDTYAVMIGDLIAGHAVCADDGWRFSKNGITFDRSGGTTSASVIPYKRSDYRLVALATLAT